MDEDFNTPKALAVLFEISKEINKLVIQSKNINEKTLELVYEIYKELGETLGLFQQKKNKEIEKKIVTDLVQILFDLREELRNKKDYKLSDKIRMRMKKAGLVVEDTAEGPKWKLA
jgi:cysteinyl-tRNA synthetase